MTSEIVIARMSTIKSGPMTASSFGLGIWRNRRGPMALPVSVPAHMKEAFERFVSRLFAGRHADDKHLIRRAPVWIDAPRFTVTSPAFVDGGTTPRQYTQEGEDRFPPLAWRDLPAGANEIVIVVEDPDAPIPRPVVRCVVYGLPSASGQLTEAEANSPNFRHFGRTRWARSTIADRDRCSATAASLRLPAVRARRVAAAERAADEEGALAHHARPRPRARRAHRHVRTAIARRPSTPAIVADGRNSGSPLKLPAHVFLSL